jgi:hypothetical protein
VQTVREFTRSAVQHRGEAGKVAPERLLLNSPPPDPANPATPPKAPAEHLTLDQPFDAALGKPGEKSGK